MGVVVLLSWMSVLVSLDTRRESIPPDVTRSGPFCMHQLKGIFGTSRIARMPKDTLITSWPATAQHVVVMYKDQFFKVPVFDGNGHVLSLNAIQK